MSKQESVLSYLLTKAGKTFKDLASYVGVEESTPYRWSRGTRTPSGQTWENLKEFLLTECEYPADCLKVLGSLEILRHYLDQDIDRDNKIIIKLRGEIDGNKTKNTLEQYLAKYRDENGNEVELPTRNLKEALESPDTIKPQIHYGGRQFAQGGRLCEESHEPNEETKAALEECIADRLSREGISLHGGGSGCSVFKVTVPRKITELIEERFRESFKHPQSHQQFIELVDCYGRYFNATSRDW